MNRPIIITTILVVALFIAYSFTGCGKSLTETITKNQVASLGIAAAGLVGIAALGSSGGGSATTSTTSVSTSTTTTTTTTSTNSTSTSTTTTTTTTTNANNWEAVGDLSSYPGSERVALSVSNSIPYVGFTLADNVTTKACVAKYDNNSWSLVGGESQGIGSCYQVSIVVSGEVVYLGFEDYGDNEVTFDHGSYVKKYDGTWSVVGTTEVTNGWGWYPMVALYNDEPYLIYQDMNSGEGATVKQFNSSLTTWEPVGTLGFSSDSAQSTQIAMATDGTVYAAFNDGGAAANKITVMKYDGSWELVGPDGFANSTNESFSLFVNGNTPYIAFSNDNEDIGGKATVQKFTDHWQDVGRAGFTDSEVSQITIFVSNDIPYVAFSDSQYSDKVSVMKLNGTSWEYVGTPGFSSFAVSQLALFVDGTTVYVAYSDDDNNLYVYKYEQ